MRSGRWCHLHPHYRECKAAAGLHATQFFDLRCFGLQLPVLAHLTCQKLGQFQGSEGHVEVMAWTWVFDPHSKIHRHLDPINIHSATHVQFVFFFKTHQSPHSEVELFTQDWAWIFYKFWNFGKVRVHGCWRSLLATVGGPQGLALACSENSACNEPYTSKKKFNPWKISSWSHSSPSYVNVSYWR